MAGDSSPSGMSSIGSGVQRPGALTPLTPMTGGGQGYANSGLARFGGGGLNPYMPQPYQPQTYQPQALAPSRGLAQMAQQPPASLLGGGGTGGSGGGIGAAGGQSVGAPSGAGTAQDGFANPDNGIAPGQTNTNGLPNAALSAAMAAIAPTPANIAAAAHAIGSISTTVGPSSVSPGVAAAAAAASAAAQSDSNPDANGSVADGDGSAGSGVGAGVGDNGASSDNGNGNGDGGGGGGGGGK